MTVALAGFVGGRWVGEEGMGGGVGEEGMGGGVCGGRCVGEEEWVEVG